jgi:hypothetical protein
MECSAEILEMGPPSVSSCTLRMARLVCHAAFPGEIHLLVGSLETRTCTCMPLARFPGEPDDHSIEPAVLDLLEYSIVWRPDATALYIALGIVDMLYAVNVHLEPRILVQRSLRMDGPVYLKRLNITAGGDFLVIRVKNSIPTVSVFRTVDLEQEALMTAPHHCRYLTMSFASLCSFEWDLFENSIEPENRRMRSDQKPHALRKKRPRLGASASISDTPEYSAICQFGNEMQLFCLPARNIRERTIVWCDVKYNWVGSIAVQWCRSSCTATTDADGQHKLHITFDGRWVCLGSTCGYFQFIDTFVLATTHESLDCRLRTFERALATATFEGTYNSLHHVRYNFQGNKQEQRSQPTLILNDVGFSKYNIRHGGKDENWLVIVEGNTVIPEVALSFLVVQEHSVLTDTTECLETIGVVSVTYSGCLTSKFPRRISLFPRNKRILHQWLRQLAQRYSLFLGEIQDVFDSDFGNLGHPRGNSWFHMLARRCKEALGVVASFLSSYEKGVLVVAYPNLVGHIYGNREYVHAVISSWAKCDSLSVPFTMKGQVTWWGRTFSDLALELVRALSIEGDVDVLEFIVQAYSEDFAGGSSWTFEHSENCTIAEAFAIRLACIRQAPSYCSPWEQHQCQNCGSAALALDQ